MRRIGPILAAIAVLLTSLSLGAARGQVLSGGQIVLCAGSTVSVQSVDVSGRPVNHVTICPDMALSLISAVAPPALPDPAPPDGFRTVEMAAGRIMATNPQRPRQGRGPPIRLA